MHRRSRLPSGFLLAAVDVASSESSTQVSRVRSSSFLVARNTLSLMVAEGASKLMVFVFFVLAARHLGTDSFGTLSLGFALVSMFSVLTDLGLGVVTTREVAQDRGSAEGLVGNSLAIKLLACSIASSAAVGLVLLGRVQRESASVIYASVPFLFGSAVSIYYGFVFQGLEKMHLTAIVRLLQTAAMVCGALFLAASSPKATSYAVVYSGAACIAALAAIAIGAFGLVRPSLRFRLGEWSSLLRRSAPLSLAVAFSMLYYWNGAALLSKLSTAHAVGTYSAPFRLVMGLGFVPAAYAGALYPVMSRRYLSSQSGLDRIARRSFTHMLLLGVGFGLLASVLASRLILVLYGPAYAESAGVLRVLALWGAFVCPNAVLAHSYYASNRAKVVTLQTAIALLVNVALNLLLIPRYGAYGAAYSVVAAEASGFALLLLAQGGGDTSRRICIDAWTLVRLAVVGILTATATALSGRLCSMLEWVVAPLAYMFGLLAFRLLPPEDIDVIRRLLQGDNAGTG